MPFAASGGISKRIIGIDAIILQFSIKRRSPYAEFPCDLAHLPAIETKGEADKLFLDLREFSDIARIVHAGDQVASAVDGRRNIRRILKNGVSFGQWRRR